MADHKLRKAATKDVTIDGRTYPMEVGNVTIALDIADWQEALSAVGDGGDLAQFRRLAEAGRAIVATAFGEEAADDLLDHAHRLDLVRMVGILSIVAEEMSAEEALAELGEAMAGFAETGDDD